MLSASSSSSQAHPTLPPSGGSLCVPSRIRSTIFDVTSKIRSAAFVRGFFVYLETEDVRAAVLYGGEDGFEQELSDVDFVVDPKAFPGLSSLIEAYCDQTGWQLCQILRHETTAAYFVCSAKDDPACAVALDACSDYQRNGTLYLPAELLLEDRQGLPWGGFKLTAAIELRYRFCKAAAKNKEVLKVFDEFERYPEHVRRDCTMWLQQTWGISLVSWTTSDLATALSEMRAQSHQRPSLHQPGALKRILSRVQQPTGLVVTTGSQCFETTAKHLEGVFSRLYFRNFRKASCWSPSMFKDLISSTLVVVPDLGKLWTAVLPTDCTYHIDAAHGPEQQCAELARHLHQRCKQREAE